MSRAQHEAIVVTSCIPRVLDAAHERAVEIFAAADAPLYANGALRLLVGDITPGLVNGCRSFTIYPDGSKLGWPEEEAATAARAELLTYLEGCRYDDGSTSLDYVHIRFGGERGVPASVLASSDRPGGVPATMTTEEVAQACKNIGYDLSCGCCAGVFFTGSAMGPHAAGCPRRSSQPEVVITMGADAPEAPARDFGAVIRAARQAAGRTLAEIAEAAKISLTHLSDIERSRRGPPAHMTIVHLATALGIPLVDLLVAAAETRGAYTLGANSPAARRTGAALMRAWALLDDEGFARIEATLGGGG